MTVEITNKKELKFIGGEYAIKKGLFNAKVSDSLYSELLELLSLSDLKNLKTWPQVLRDAPEYTLEIAYDNQIKCLKTFLLPSVCGDLIHYLYAVPGKVVLQKQEEPIELHFQEIVANILIQSILTKIIRAIILLVKMLLWRKKNVLVL
ncbi:hypothetical protein MKP07_16080 [Niabella hibiscisoli]|nr:hypothetical protein [Niabella hibiscisoli]